MATNAPETVEKAPMGAPDPISFLITIRSRESRRSRRAASRLARNFPLRGCGFVLSLTLLVACGPSQEDLDTANSRANDLQSALETEQQERQSSNERVQQLTAENEQMANRLTELGENVEELRGSVQTLETNVETLEGERTDLRSSLTETQRALEELRERERQSQARLATFRALIARFQSMIDSGQLRVRVVRNRMIVELPAGVLFDSGRAELKEEGQAALDQVSAILVEVEGREFQIAGHTDNVPMRTRRFQDNWQLSTARAVNVTRYMLAHGIPPARLSAAGFADTQPTASNDSEEGRRQNRRIEIVLVPNLDELPDLSALQ